jgi:hypothetical protein
MKRILFSPFERKDETALADPPAAAGHRTVTLFRGFEVKAVDEAARTFSGLAAAFSQDLGGDVILPGAFKRTIADWKRSKKILPLLDSHNGWGTVRAVVGKTLEAAEVDDGLEAKFQVIDGPDGDEIFRRVKGGYVDGLSIGYRPIQVKLPTDEEAQRGIFRFLKEVALKEISVCIWPMNPDARIDMGTVKHLLAIARDRALSSEELDELKSVHSSICALLAATAPAPATVPGAAPAVVGLALEDPRRIAVDERVRNLTLAGLGIGRS